MTYIKITHRHIHPRRQPVAVNEGDILRVVDTIGDKLKATHQLQGSITAKTKVYTVSPQCFTWETYTDLRDLIKDIALKQSQDTIQRMADTLTEEEIVRVSVIPLIIERIAWTYCEKARDIAADRKVEIFKKLSRSFYHLKDTYERSLTDHLSREQIQLVHSITDRFLETYHLDFVKFYFTTDNIFLRYYPDDPHRELRLHGILAKLLTKTAQKYRQIADERFLVSRGLVDSPTGSEYKVISALHDIADAFAGDDRAFDYEDRNLSNALGSLLIKLQTIKYDPQTQEIEI